MRITCLITIIFLALNLFGQESSLSRIIIGGDIQLSYSAIPDLLPGSRTSFTGGANFEYLLSKNSSLKSGIYYDGKGVTDKMELFDASGESIGESIRYFNFNYLTIPFLYSFSVYKRLFFLNIGPFVSYNINNPYFDMPKIDLGYSIGGGINIPLNEKLSLSGSLKLDKSIAGLFPSSSQMQNILLGGLVGVKWRL
jgi:hypothetical protein